MSSPEQYRNWRCTKQPGNFLSHSPLCQFFLLLLMDILMCQICAWLISEFEWGISEFVGANGVLWTGWIFSDECERVREVMNEYQRVNRIKKSSLESVMMKWYYRWLGIVRVFGISLNWWSELAFCCNWLCKSVISIELVEVASKWVMS